MGCCAGVRLWVDVEGCVGMLKGNVVGNHARLCGMESCGLMLWSVQLRTVKARPPALLLELIQHLLFMFNLLLHCAGMKHTEC